MKFRVIIMILIAAVSLSSCSIDDGSSPVVDYEVIPVVSVDLPQIFTFGQTHVIPVTFDYTNTCQDFAGFEVSSNLNERIITVVASVTNEGCQEEIRRSSQNINFIAASNGTYIFKFFTGLDNNNEPTYMEYTIPVEE